MAQAAISVAGNPTLHATNRPAFRTPEATALVREVRLLAAAWKESRSSLPDRVPWATCRAATQYGCSTDFVPFLSDDHFSQSAITASLLAAWKERINDPWIEKKTELRTLMTKMERDNIRKSVERA
eukprot:1924766-Rhodomonas_salina.2